MNRYELAGALGATMLALAALAAKPAAAGSEHLQCHAGFLKVQTYANSILCKRASSSFPHEIIARKRAKTWADSASCNAHMSAPKKKVWKKGGRWAVRVTFICANIT